MAVLRASESRRGERRGIVLDLGDLRVEAERLEAESRARAESILAEAEQERGRILKGAEEEGRAAGMERGLAEGREAGSAEGRDAAMGERRERLERLIESWGGALEELEFRRDRIVSDARQDVVSYTTTHNHSGTSGKEGEGENTSGPAILSFIERLSFGGT